MGDIIIYAYTILELLKTGVVYTGDVTIHRGSFIGIYAGEIITEEESQKREELRRSLNIHMIYMLIAIQVI